MTKIQQDFVVKASGGSVYPDPAIYCPANGYIPEPGTYVPIEPIVNTPEPTNNQIILLITDVGDRNLYFYCNISSSGQYTVSIYGNNNILIYQLNVNNGQYFNYILPLGSGYLYDSYTYYRVIITPTIPSNSITRFQPSTQSSYDTAGNKVFAIKLNCPSLTTCASMFYNHQYIRHVEFIGACNSLTTLYRAFFGTTSLEELILPTSMDSLTTMESILQSSGIKKIVLNNTYPLLTTLINAFNSSFAYEVELGGTFPSLTSIERVCNTMPNLLKVSITGTFPVLQRLSYALYSNPVLKTLIITSTFPNSTLWENFAYACYNLEGDIKIMGDMNSVTLINSAFQYCYKLNSLEFIGTMNSCTNIAGIVSNCTSLKLLRLPSALPSISATGQTNFCSNTGVLETVYLPEIWNPATLTGNTNNSPWTINNSVVTLSKILVGPSQPMYWNWSYFSSILILDQPNLKVSTISLNQAGGTTVNSIRSKLEYVDFDFSMCTSIYIQYTSIGYDEIKRILDKLPNYSGQTLKSATLQYNKVLTGIVVKSGANATNITSYLVNVSAGGTSGIEVGMYMDHISWYNNRTLSLSEGIITKTSHGFSEGQNMILLTISGITGLTITTLYYVVNVTTDTFQLSLTLNGEPVNFTGTGTCTIQVYPRVVSINSATQITIDMYPGIVSNSGALFTNLNLMDYLAKGWKPSVWN